MRGAQNERRSDACHFEAGLGAQWQERSARAFCLRSGRSGSFFHLEMERFSIFEAKIKPFPEVLAQGFHGFCHFGTN